MDGALSEDTLLGGLVRLRQRRDGYRVAIDPVLLAAAVPARDGERIIDVGAGTGAAALCLAARVPGVSVVGLELFPEHVALARENIALNGVAKRLTIVEGDLAEPPAALSSGGFHHVMANPPHLRADSARPSPDPARAIANVEGAADLDAWIAFCLAMVRPGGSITIVHRAERADEVGRALARGAGGIVVLPLLAKAGGTAKRVIVQARKGIEVGKPRILPGLVLHGDGGGYSEAAEAVLRGGEALDLGA